MIGAGNLSFGFLDKIEDTNLFFGLSILVRVFIAVGEAGLNPAAFALAGKQVSAENQGKATSLAESFFGVGSMFGPTIGGYLFDKGGFSLPFWASGGFSLLLSFSCIFLMRNVEEAFQDVAEDRKDVTWREILTAPGVGVSFWAMVCAGTAWQWYSPSLEPFLVQTYGVSSFQTGLVFMAFGVTYTIFTPIVGFLTDRGLDGITVIILGNLCILLAFVLLGPIPPVKSLVGGGLGLTVFSVGLQGLGSGATYLGSLLLMMRGVVTAGLPDKEQTRAMVSSLWVISDCIGGYLGTSLGSLAFDNLGFAASTMVMAAVTLSSVLVTCVYMAGTRSTAELGETAASSSQETQRLLGGGKVERKTNQDHAEENCENYVC